MSKLKVAIGPVLFLWQKSVMDSFYEQVAHSSADIVYLGESVCGKRRLSRQEDYLRWASQLSEQGKQVVCSTLALLESPAQVSALKKVCRDTSLLFEANDLAAVQVLSELNQPFVIGPAINVYNGYTLMKLAKMGAKRWVMPVELSQTWLMALKAEYASLCDLPMEYEVFSYGYLPLAYSARCFTARHHDLAKDACDLICQSHPQGLKTQSQDGKALFVLNGIQTMSGQIYNLCEEAAQLADIADIARISAHQSEDMDWIESFSGHRNTPRPANHINGYWHDLAGMASDALKL
ncbi:U32 family peptidase [Pseudoalteromonas sp. OOF1S-7]|uniref:U32 family peptidase n=1 Tax=Pseudoalteromonas sp. OOF1S-7 TaxID=2917757 RepID=UPI001EF687AC|nr:U32 family peptidase [Pseudoalteromonas sp. OOF1S-7]MCG7533459.1 U32 family peptidase [Pseudoalteromonas sp. OOF1S-7]